MNLFYFTIDGFRITQLVIAIIVFAFTSVFSKSYFKGEKISARFYVSIAITFLAVVGIFLSDSLFTLFFFFEIMSFASYFWLTEKKESLKTSYLYLAVSVISGMVMLMGMFILNNELGTLVISEISSLNVEHTTMLYVGAGLALVGFCTKAGMYPLHIWLPKTYFDSPSPQTAVFSAVLSKVGVFGAIVVSNSLFLGNEQWGQVLLVFATLTMIWGGLCAVVSRDMKKTIAYSSMSQIGFIIFGIATQAMLTEHQAVSANGIVIHMVNHSAFKLILFTLCAIAFMNVGSTDFSKIKGMARKNKVFAVSFITAGGGLMGIPLLSGYVSKTLLHEGIVEQIHLTHNNVYSLFEYLFIFSGGLTTCYILKLGFILFAKPENNQKLKISPFCSAVLLIVSMAIVVGGVLPNLVTDKLAEIASGFMIVEPLHDSINYFSFINLKGAIYSISVGILLYVFVYKPLFSKRKKEQIIPNAVSLENIYTQIIIKDIPFIIYGVSVFLDKYLIEWLYKFSIKLLDIYSSVTARMTDFIGEMLFMFGFKALKEKDPEDRTPSSYKLGNSIDHSLAFLHIKLKKPLADTLLDFEAQSAIRRRMISSSLSYGLLFAGVGLIVVLLYMLFS